MIAVKDIMKYTGYIRGGCSPIGMKKNYKTFIHESAEDLDFIIFSAGKIGHQIKNESKRLSKCCRREICIFNKIVKTN